MTKISAVIIAFNEEDRIGKTLEHLQWCDEILVVDSGSTDQTVAICRQADCKVLFREFDDYGTQKQFAVDQAANDWVLSVDADEVITPELKNEILKIFKNKPQVNGFFIKRSTYFLGKVLKFCGLRREKVLRLFNRNEGKFVHTGIHERIEMEGETAVLKHRMLHYSYRDISDHLSKIDKYTTLAAKNYVEKNKRYSKLMVALKFPGRFLLVYFIKGGFLDGYQGFMWSMLAGVYASLKYAKFREMRDKLSKKQAE